MRLCLTFVFRLNHKQTLKMSDESSANERKYVHEKKTIIGFGIGCYLVYQY